ncbi:MAG TPA: TOMM precursor leader peptide-binding protein [Ktedonobacteraceae bacterium]|nr:TOMM precursor leader peptide-binding protein [Ktedonobacteraceae bacterium]
MDQNGPISFSDISRRYRCPALKRTWFIDSAGSSVTFTPLTPGLRAFVLAHVTSSQRRLLELLKGEYSLEMIQGRLHDEFPRLPSNAVAAMLDQLDRAGLLEEANPEPPADWTPEYLYRYSRLLAVYAGYERPDLSRFEQQRRIRSAHIVLLGAGGIGSWIALLLGQLGIGHLTIADDDAINSSNLTRHALFTERDIGRNKAQAAADALHRLNSEMEVTVIPRLIETEEEMIAVSRGADLVIVTFGPFFLATPMLIQRACFRAGIPYVALGGLHLGPLVVPGKTACFACAQSLITAGQASSSSVGFERREEVVLERGYYGIFAPLVATSTGLGAMEIAKFITGFAPSALANGLLYLNPTDLTLMRLAIPRNPTCPICGEAE